jgi:hypothetical protein
MICTLGDKQDVRWWGGIKSYPCGKAIDRMAYDKDRSKYAGMKDSGM